MLQSRVHGAAIEGIFCQGALQRHQRLWMGMGKIVSATSVPSCLEPPKIAAQGVDAIIFNPPFRLAEQVHRARVARSRGSRSSPRWCDTRFAPRAVGRYERLYSNNPPSFIRGISRERVPIGQRGRCDPDVRARRPYSWFVWMMGETATCGHIGFQPCRKRLEREEDYI